jgi:hypothetical protein
LGWKSSIFLKKYASAGTNNRLPCRSGGVKINPLLDSIVSRHLKFEPSMRSINHFFRLLLTIALVLSPLQGAFAAAPVMHANMQADTSMVMAGHDDLQKFANGCGEHAATDACQGSTSCGSCPMSVGIPQMTSIASASVEPLVVGVTFTTPLRRAERSPDDRPPRYS